MPQQRFEGPSLEAVLADVADRLGPGAAIVEANKLRRGGVAGFFARERYEVLVEAGAEPLLSTDPLPSTEKPQFSAMLDALIAQAGAEDDFSTTDTPPTRPSTEEDAARVTFPEIAEMPETPAAPARGGDLVRLGLPEELVSAPDPRADTARWIAGLMERAPRPARLPRGRGTVVASVGGRDAALELARDLASELGLDPAGVVLASSGYRGRALPVHQRLASVEMAEEHRRSWRRRPRPTVVAVEAVPGRAPNVEWGRRVLDVLEPSMVWAAVEATRKPEDITAWAERLGGIDALSVTALAETESPAAVLRCGLPVGRLEGRPATPALWGALLAERLGTAC